MVNLTPSDKNLISDAIARAEENTAAEIAVMLAPASDHYLHYGLMVGIALGSLISSGLWYWHVLPSYPLLLAVQLVVVFICGITPALSRWLVPKAERRWRAEQKAIVELAHITAPLPATTPVLLLHLSLAEKHVYVLPNPVIRAAIADEIWQPLVKEFTKSLNSRNLAVSCVKLLAAISAILAQAFPDDGAANAVSNKIIESK